MEIVEGQTTFVGLYRLVALLQHAELTIDEIATKLGLTANAVRVQITGMERDGVVQRRGQRPGTTRPSYLIPKSLVPNPCL